MPDDSLELVLADYLRRIDAGERVDRDAFVAQHPHVAADLQSFFRHRDALERIAEPLRTASSGGPRGGNDLDTLASDAPTAGESGRVRLRYFGDYELIEELARGGMGVVYRARQMSLNRPVAVKMILSGEIAGAEAIQRFRQEAEAAANLDHPHIVPIYEIGEHAGQHYFSMKLIEGGSLRSELPRLRADVRAGVQLLATVARAVHHAHQRGVLHRDLKPGNVLIDAAGQPHVTDFGLAKQVESDGERGNPRYARLHGPGTSERREGTHDGRRCL